LVTGETRQWEGNIFQKKLAIRQLAKSWKHRCFSCFAASSGPSPDLWVAPLESSMLDCTPIDLNYVLLYIYEQRYNIINPREAPPPDRRLLSAPLSISEKRTPLLRVLLVVSPPPYPAIAFIPPPYGVEDRYRATHRKLREHITKIYPR
jgi:hypothetical protein